MYEACAPHRREHPFPGRGSGGSAVVQGPSPAPRSAGPAVALDPVRTLRRPAAPFIAARGRGDVFLFSRFFPSIPPVGLYKPDRGVWGRPEERPVRREVASRLAQPRRGSLLSS